MSAVVCSGGAIVTAHGFFNHSSSYSISLFLKQASCTTCYSLYFFFSLDYNFGLGAQKINSFFLVVFQCDLLDMPAVGQLEKDTKYALVYQLLKIFLTQRLDAYLDFHAANSTLLKSYGNCFLILQHLKPCSGR